MKNATTIKLIARTARVAILVAAIGCVACLGVSVDGHVNALVPAVFLALLGGFVMYAARRSIQSRHPRAARKQFLKNHSMDIDSPDNGSGNAHFDADAVVIGSSAWLIEHDLTSAFPSYGSFTDSLNAFDHGVFASTASLSAFDDDVFTSHFSLHIFDHDGFTNHVSLNIFDSPNTFDDYVHGGTDCTGMHGLGGHNDQGWGTDSHSFSMSDSTSFSHDSFSSSSDDSSISFSHESFSSSSRDPFP